MKSIMIATDIHGSYYYAKKIVDRYLSSGCDKLVLLGDLYYHGPRNPLPEGYDPMAVSTLFNGIADELIVVQGNCDSEVDQMISQFAFERIANIAVVNCKVVATHGHVYNADSIPPDMQSGVLVYGHFHVSQIVNVGDVIAVNVGSASLPKDSHHAYCIIDDSVTVYDLLDSSVLCSCTL